MGAISAVDAKNPFPWGTAMAMEWNYGRLNNAHCYAARSKNRMRTVGRYTLFGAVVGMVVSLTMFYFRSSP